MAGLNELLKALGASAELEARYGHDPEAVMEQFGLSEDEKAALRSGDMERIKALSGCSELSSSNTTFKSYD
ncbi:hypothetical protein [Natronospira bacteriovora]|uniref:Extradiol ring-cleavage dioxygenase LigAB LigA subunit domain-containing protein n=1 Tax=Natronospira bacteriovora TaxID=3069753 RepID=A0ABU0W7W8_9GAMM|nr:hypothetical protein [Natronospira sp. AB-CW4]MDQ2070086.1 hypothetical protein [Natronospira sp. AB-CW4]